MAESVEYQSTAADAGLREGAGRARMTSDSGQSAATLQRYRDALGHIAIEDDADCAAFTFDTPPEVQRQEGGQ